MRKNKVGILKTDDTPCCSECKVPLAIDDTLFAAMPADQVSGYVWELPCPVCGSVQNVSPTIVWHTWVAE